MIGFAPTAEQEQMRQLAHRFAEREIRQAAAEYDESEETPWPILEKAAQIGLTSYQYPEEYGGGGVTSILTACLVAEELAWGKHLLHRSPCRGPTDPKEATQHFTGGVQTQSDRCHQQPISIDQRERMTGPRRTNPIRTSRPRQRVVFYKPTRL